MTGGFATRRRAERFDALLSGESAGADSGDAELARLVSAIRALPEVEARPEFVTSLRERLVAEAATRPAPDRATVEHLSLRQPAVRRERRIATVLGGLAVASATTAMAVASQDALPGDTLYPVKRAIESAETGFQSDEAGRATTLLEHAEQRLVEARALSADGPEDADGAAVSEALDRFSSQANEGAALAIRDYRETRDADGLSTLRTFTAASLAELNAMSDEVPESARASLVGAVNTVQSIEGAVTQACPTCGGPAALPDPLLVANLQDLLSAKPEALLSLAIAAEDIAGQVPTAPTAGPSAAPTPSEGPTPAAPSTIDGTTTPSPTPSPTLPSRDLTTSVPTPEEGPVRTLLGEASNDLEDQQAGADDWTLLDNDLTDTLGLSDSTEGPLG